MDQVLNTFFSTEFIVLCVVISVIISFLRTFIEWLGEKFFYILPDQYEHWWVVLWRSYVLPSLPIVVGALIGYFVEDYAYPETFKTSLSARIFYGVFAGMCSGYTYSRVRAFFTKILPKMLDAQTKANFPQVAEDLDKAKDEVEKEEVKKEETEI